MPEIPATIQRTVFSARILVTAACELPAYSIGSTEVKFIVDTGADATVLAFADWTRIIAPAQRESLPRNSGAQSPGGLVQGSLTRATLRFRATDGLQHTVALDYVFLSLNRAAGMPSLLGMDVLMRGGLTLDGPSRQATLSLP